MNSVSFDGKRLCCDHAVDCADVYKALSEIHRVACALMVGNDRHLRNHSYLHCVPKKIVTTSSMIS